ncbi:MAG: hypothetical protein C4570_03970 [Ammonifex sp.]|nr:MAG: hypothetical protein C4570_03970 [Ammonifex sp.]
MLAGKRILFVLKNPPAERWLAGRCSGADVKFDDLPEGWSPDAVVVVGRSPAGGVDDPAAVVEQALSKGDNPVCLVVSGHASALERRLHLLGVPEECVVWANGAGVRPSEVLKKLGEAVEKDLRPEPVVFAFPGEEPLLHAGAPEKTAPLAPREAPASLAAKAFRGGEAPVNWSALAPHRDKIVVVTGSGTGVGRTTLAAALATHAFSLEEKVAAVDLDPSPELALHLQRPQLLPVREDGLERWLRGRSRYGSFYAPDGASDLDLFVLLGVLASRGETLVVDAPLGFAPWDEFARVVFVVGSDLRALDGAKGKIPAGAVVVASRVQPADANVWPGVVEDALGVKPAAVLVEDPEGCRAAGARFAPATESPGSTMLARAIGELAPLIFGKGR